MYCCYRFCCTIVTIFVVLLLPLLLHCDYRFCCISNFLLQLRFDILYLQMFYICCVNKTLRAIKKRKKWIGLKWP